MRETKIAFIGGDMRQLSAALRVRELGYGVCVWGIPGADRGGLEVLQNFEEAFLADALVLPLPMSGDGIFINCIGEFCERAPKISEIFERAENKPIFAGRISPKIKSEGERLGIRLCDYFESEELKIKNAYLTAEGAVSLAMNELNIALSGTKTAVIGYGRIGKFLSRMLSSLDSSVTLAARKGTDLAYAAGFGFDTLKIEIAGGESSLCSLSGYDVIFNTAPYWLFDASVLGKFTSETLFIDLASAPGGIDPAAAEEKGIRVISAQGLPGKYAPVSAGRFVGDAVAEMIPKLLRKDFE
jgi:dipicolinate synthase subunit A